MFVEAVLVAVDLDDNARTSALEIDDVVCERRLASEVMTECTQFPKLDPQLHFLLRHRFAEFAGDIVGHTKHSAPLQHPHPAAQRPPSPSGRDGTDPAAAAPPGRFAATLPFGEG